jgi:hypothetical protein
MEDEQAMNTVVNQTIIRSRPRQTRYPLVITTLHVSFFLNLHKGSDHVLIMAFFINHLWTFILRYDNTTFVLHTDNCPCLVLFTIKNVDLVSYVSMASPTEMSSASPDLARGFSYCN